jgi:dimethylhistidine N-methyltransferase
LLVAALLARMPVRWLPIDLSPTALEESAHELCAEFPALEVQAIVAEYGAVFDLLAAPSPRARLVLWLGSNIGNLDPDDAAAFLRRIAGHLGPADRLLVGVDLRRPAREHEAGYDDAAGVTARFNLNLLERINRELGADFRLERFRHRARYDAGRGRVEMYLDSAVAQTVHIARLGRSFDFGAGEAVHTESSYKYSLDGIAALADKACLALDGQWTDGRFAVSLLRARR